MKIYKSILVLVIITSFAFVKAHKYYVSITKIEYVKERESLQIISRIFIDDFETLLKQRYDESLVLNSKFNEDQVDEYIKDYILSKLKIKINERNANVLFLGKEYDEDVVQCFLEIENVKEIKTFEIKNKVLFDSFSEQKNIVRTNINGKNKSFILIPENNRGMLNF